MGGANNYFAHTQLPLCGFNAPIVEVGYTALLMRNGCAFVEVNARIYGLLIKTLKDVVDLPLNNVLLQYCQLNVRLVEIHVIRQWDRAEDDTKSTRQTQQQCSENSIPLWAGGRTTI